MEFVRRFHWNYLLTRLTEAGTWRGILLGLGLLRFRISDQTAQQITDFGMFVAVLMQGWLPELGSPVTTDIGAAKKAAGIPLDQALPPAPAATASAIPVSMSHETPKD